MEKHALSLTELDRQAGFELPDREMMALINIIVFDVIDGGVSVLNNLNLEVKNNNVAVQVCAIVNALSFTTALPGLTCTVTQ